MFCLIGWLTFNLNERFEIETDAFSVTDKLPGCCMNTE